MIARLVRTTLIGNFFFPRGSFETRSAMVLSSYILAQIGHPKNVRA
jgi:hypothetical protein